MKQSPPTPGPERNVAYPRIPGQTLENGLEVLTVFDDRLPRVSITLVLPVGRTGNPEDNSSLIPLAVELMKSGTETRSARELSALMDRFAIHYESDTLMEHSYISMAFLRPQLETAMELLSDIVLGAAFPEEEATRTRTRWKSQLMAQRSQPGFLAEECLAKALYGDHPYARVSIRPEHLEQTSAGLVADTFRARGGPRGSYLLFAGPVDLEESLRLSDRSLGAWEDGAPHPVTLPQAPEVGGRRICLVHRAHSVQSHVLVGGRTLPRADPQMLDLRVTNQILGGGASARLFLNLREQKGYTYGAYSQLKSYSRDGLFMAGASVKTEVTLESLEEILKELDSLQREPPAEEELIRCRQEIIGSFIRQMETPSSVAFLELDKRLYGIPDDYYEQLIPRVRKVGAETVKETAKRFFDPARALVVIVADRDRVEGPLAKMGDLEVYDANGNPL